MLDHVLSTVPLDKIAAKMAAKARKAARKARINNSSTDCTRRRRHLRDIKQRHRQSVDNDHFASHHLNTADHPTIHEWRHEMKHHVPHRFLLPIGIYVALHVMAELLSQASRAPHL